MSDLDNIMSWINDKGVVGNFSWFSGKITREAEAKILRNLLRSRDVVSYAIENEKHEYVGNISLHKEKRSKARLSIVIGNKKEWSKGHAQRAIRLMLGKAFSKLKLNEVYLVCLQKNRKARHLYEKCGFKEKAILHKAYLLRGRKRNMVKFVITKKEFGKPKVLFNVECYFLFGNFLAFYC